MTTKVMKKGTNLEKGDVIKGMLRNNGYNPNTIHSLYRQSMKIWIIQLMVKYQLYI